MGIKSGHRRKVSYSIVEMRVGNMMVDKNAILKNASFPMSVALLGIVMVVTRMEAKANIPMLVSTLVELSGRLMADKVEH